MNRYYHFQQNIVTYQYLFIKMIINTIAKIIRKITNAPIPKPIFNQNISDVKK